MAEGLAVDEIIQINTEIRDGGSPRAEFGTGLLLTKSSLIPGNGPTRCRRYRNMNDIVEDFPSATDTVHRDAQVWFSADPAPLPLYIGRWRQASVNTQFLGGTMSTSDIDAVKINNGTFSIDGQSPGTDVNLSSAADATTIASTMQTAINALSNISGATVQWVAANSRFELTFDGTGEFDIEEPTGGGANDVLRLMKLSTYTYNGTAGAGSYFPGGAPESLAAAVAGCVNLATAGAPTALMLASDIANLEGTTNTREAMRAIAQAGDYMYAQLDTSATARTQPITATLAADPSETRAAFSAGQSNVIPVYSRGVDASIAETYAPRPDIGIMAKLSSQNFDLPASIITLQAKTLPGVATSNITSTELATLGGKRATVYTNVGGLPTLLGGYTARAGIWADAQWWLLWLKNEMERSIFGAMRSSRRLNKAILADTIGEVMAKAVNSGGAQPGGVVNNSVRDDIRRVTGNHEFDGVLDTGYILHIDPPQAQTAEDRANRIGRFTVWVAPSQAIHTVASAIIMSG